RHAVPLAPWPWTDTWESDDVNRTQLDLQVQPASEDCDHSNCEGNCWKRYPQSLFPDWTQEQMERSRIYDGIVNYDHAKQCKIYKLNLDSDWRTFRDAGTMTIRMDERAVLLDEKWDQLKDDNRMRVLFVENMAGPALRMLGGMYKIEPHFFSSSLRWMPSHIQQDLRQGVGDHITIILPFIRSRNEAEIPLIYDQHTLPHGLRGCERWCKFSLLYCLLASVSQTDRTLAPLRLESNKKALVLDLLSVHLVRNHGMNAMISFHANAELPTTSANDLRERIRVASQHVYWKNIQGRTDDPTFVLLMFFWQVEYAWEKALRHLYEHVCVVETDKIQASSAEFTDGLHVTRAHLLFYSYLLSTFKRTVSFISNTPNPALPDSEDKLLSQECATLLETIERLDKECTTQATRLKDIMDLVSTSYRHSFDSKNTQRMTEAAIRDSAAMKQIAYLTTIFLPATFIAGVFGMHVKEIDSGRVTLSQYFETTCAMTAVTIWVLVAFQCSNLFNMEMPFWKRLGWPIYLAYGAMEKAGYLEKFIRGSKRGILPLFNR
ncbi:hypothetical protein F5887DRAFT_889727, partial [Amanita rubescens]